MKSEPQKAYWGGKERVGSVEVVLGAFSRKYFGAIREMKDVKLLISVRFGETTSSLNGYLLWLRDEGKNLRWIWG